MKLQNTCGRLGRGGCTYVYIRSDFFCDSMGGYSSVSVARLGCLLFPRPAQQVFWRKATAPTPPPPKISQLVHDEGQREAPHLFSLLANVT